MFKAIGFYEFLGGTFVEHGFEGFAVGAFGFLKDLPNLLDDWLCVVISYPSNVLSHHHFDGCKDVFDHIVLLGSRTLPISGSLLGC